MHITFVQSLGMDAWTEEMVDKFKQLGPNERANRDKLEYHVPAEYAKASPNCSRCDRERYIKAKYEARFGPNEDAAGEATRPPLPPVQMSDPANEGFSDDEEDEMSDLDGA